MTAMTRLLVLAAVVAAGLFRCDAAPSTIVIITPAAPAAPAMAQVARGPITTADGRVYAVVRLVAAWSECTNLGGDHAILEVDEPAHRRVHVGGHGAHLQLGLFSPWFGNEPRPPADAPRYFIAQVEMRDGDRIAAGEIGDCMGRRWPVPEGIASDLVRARDLDAARLRLAELVAVDQSPTGAW